MKTELKRKINEYLAKHQFLQEIGETQLAIEDILDRLAVPPTDLPEKAVVHERLRSGVPLMQHADIQKRVIDAVEEIMPSFLLEMQKLPLLTEPMCLACKRLRVYGKENKLRSILDCIFRQEDSELKNLLAGTELNEALLRSISWQIVAHLVPDEVKTGAYWETEKNPVWEKNYCPVCGRRPVLAQLKKEQQGKKRYLHCGGCQTNWSYKRLGCVYCGNDNLKRQHLLEPEGEADMRLDVCEECNTYIKTYVNEGNEAVYMQDWATIHLDLLGEEKGLQKKGNIMLGE